MPDLIEILIRAATSYDGGLDKVSDALKSIGNATGLSASQLKALEAEFARLSAAGLNFKQIIGSIASSGNNLGAGVGAAAKQIQTSLNQAAQAAQNLNAQLKGTQQAAGGLQNAVANPFNALKTAAVNATAALGPAGIAIGVVAAAATLGAKAMFDLVDSQGAAAQATLNMATQVGISAGAMQKLQVEGRIIGVSFQTMQMAARQLAMGLEEPTGAGKRVAQALHDLGIASVDSGLQVRQEGVVFEEAVKALGNIEDQTKRTEEATKLFGARGAASLGLVIANYKELDAAARELGYVDNTALIESLAKGHQEIEKMNAAFTLLLQTFAKEISPIVIPFVVTVKEILAEPTAADRDDDKHSMESTPAREKRQQADMTASGMGHATGMTLAASLKPQMDAAFKDANAALLANRAAGAAILEQSSTRLAGTLDGISAEIAAVKQKIKEDNDKIALGKQSGNVTKEAAKEVTDALAQHEAQKQSLEARKKAIEEANRSAEEIARTFKKIEENLKNPGLIGPENLLKAQGEQSKLLGQAGSNTRYQQDARDLYAVQTTKYIDDLIGKEQSEAGKKMRESIEKMAKERERLFDSFIKGQDKLAEQERLLTIDADEQRAKIQGTSDKAARSLQRERVLGYAKLSGGENAGTAQLEGNFQASAINEDASSHVAELTKLIAQLQADPDQTFEVEKKISDLRIESDKTTRTAEDGIAKVRLDTELKVAELRQKELDSYKQQAGQIFDALRQPGGRGLQDYFRAQTNELAKGVFSNATAPILRNIGQSLGGATSGLPPEIQGLFKGTILDSAHAKTPQIAATDANTIAVNALTVALTGQTVGGQSITPAPGSPGAATASASSSAVSPLVKLLGGGGGSSGSAAIPSGLSQFLKGATGGIGNWDEIFHGKGKDTIDPLTGQKIPTYVSKTEQAGAAIGTAATAGAGIYEAVNQFSKGGASGIAGGIGAAAGTAAMLDPEPISKMILGSVSLISELFKGLLPDPHTIREAAIANQQQYNTYVAPPILKRSLSASGGFEQVNDKYGLPSATTFSSVAIQAPYKYKSPITDPSGLYQNWEGAPGQVIEPYQAAAAQPNWMTSQAPSAIQVHMTVNAMDAQSFLDARGKISAAVQMSVVEGHPVGNALQRAILGS